MDSKLVIRRVVAAALGISVAAMFVAISPAEAGSKKKKSKCSITGTEGPDFIFVENFFAPASGGDLDFFSEEAETVCALGGDDAVHINYEHPGVTKVSLGDGNDCTEIGDNGSQESVDGGKGADLADPDLSDGDTVKSIEGNSEGECSDGDS